MTTGLNNKIHSIVLVGSVLLISACASVKSGDSIKTDKAVTDKADGTTRTVIQKGQFETPPEIEPHILKQATAAITPAPDSPRSTRIGQKEPLVNVRSAPTTKSRSIAVLKSGQVVEVLETKDSWAKISWQLGEAAKQGWTKKAFVEGL